MKTVFTLLILAASLVQAQVKVYAPEAKTTTTRVNVRVRVKALSEVSGPRFRLDDIADIEASAELKAKLGQIDLGVAPTAGIPRPVVPARILSVLMIAGLKAKEIDLQVPTDARIALKVQKVEQAKFVDAARQAVLPLIGPQVQVSSSQTFPDFVAPLGELTLEAGRPAKSTNGFTVLVSIYVDGKKVNSRLINLAVDASSAAAAIKAGDTIRIYLRSAGATIEVSGRARTAGFTGQQITVISNTGSVHQATVLSASEAEVKL
jgi:hypothetical protein